LFEATATTMTQHWRKFVVLASLLAALPACTGLPTQGPSGAAIEANAVERTEKDNRTVLADYVLINISGQNIDHFRTVRSAGLQDRLRSRGAAPGIRIGIGDTVGVTIYESGAGGLFSPPDAAQLRSGNFVELPPQVVDNNGNISVPYAGQVAAAGRLPSQIQDTIVSRLRNRAIEPQAVVSVREQRATQVSVLGSVNLPAKFSINPRGDRILDAIARAGGIKSEGHESFVTIQRDQQKVSVPFDTLVADPGSNIFVQPGDIIYVSRQVQSFIAIGASKQNGKVSFEAATLTLAEALGKTAGLLDDRAEPGAMYIYRLENRDRVRRLGLSTEKFTGHTIPVIYALDFRDPSSPHLASQFQMQNNDVLYVSNAAFTEVVKALNVVRAGTGIFSDIRRISTN
jgi:polysaccharide biosynthesis/export protein